MEFSGHALVLRVGRFREADLWVRFLSSSRGMNTAFAFGGSRSRRRFCGCLDQLNVVNFRVSSSRTGNFLYLQEGVLLRGPSRLRHDWRRCGVALNCLKFIEAFGVPPDSAGPAFSLATDLMDCLEQVDGQTQALPLFFRARFAFDQGYAVDFSTCAHCGAPLDSTAFFLPIEGTALCPACPLPNGQFLRISADAIRVFYAIQHSSPKDWMDLAIPPPVLRECGRAIDAFIQRHVGLMWDDGRFKRI